MEVRKRRKKKVNARSQAEVTDGPVRRRKKKRVVRGPDTIWRLRVRYGPPHEGLEMETNETGRTAQEAFEKLSTNWPTPAPGSWQLKRHQLVREA